VLSNHIKFIWRHNNWCQTGLQDRKTCTNRSPKHNKRWNKATPNTTRKPSWRCQTRAT